MINTRSWKDAIMDGALSITEVVVSVIKAISIIGGIIGANLADIGFGTLALSFMFGGSILNIASMTANNWLSVFVSSGTTAIQIALWTLLAKRGIGFKHLINFKKLPSDIQGFILGAGVVWLADTLLDISPLSILIRGSLYEGGSWFAIVKIIVYLLVFLLCGFAEPLTANMRQMLENGSKPSTSTTYNNNNNRGNQGGGNSYNRGNTNSGKPHQTTNNNQNNQNGNTNNNHTNTARTNVSSYLASKQAGGKPVRPIPVAPTYHQVKAYEADASIPEDDELEIESYMKKLNNLYGEEE